MFQVKSDTEQECKRVRHHQEVDRHRQTETKKEAAGDTELSS